MLLENTCLMIDRFANIKLTRCTRRAGYLTEVDNNEIFHLKRQQ